MRIPFNKYDWLMILSCLACIWNEHFMIESLKMSIIYLYTLIITSLLFYNHHSSENFVNAFIFIPSLFLYRNPFSYVTFCTYKFQSNFKYAIYI